MVAKCPQNEKHSTEKALPPSSHLTVLWVLYEGSFMLSLGVTLSDSKKITFLCQLKQ